jgi:Tol biopolymer transport system component
MWVSKPIRCGLVVAVSLGMTVALPAGVVAQETVAGRIVFLSDRGGGDAIYTMRPDGGDVTRISLGAKPEPAWSIGRPCWSPDGNRILFFVRKQRGGAVALEGTVYITETDGSSVRELGPGGDPAWSPDGMQIAFSSWRGGNLDIWLMDLTDSTVGNLTQYPETDREPAWSPDGKRIVFTSFREGGMGLYVMNVDGSAVRLLKQTETVIADPTWSPDGSRIAFTSMDPETYNMEVYIINSDGSDAVNLTNDEGMDFGPVWSPDGKSIAFTSDRNGNKDIFLTRLDGTGVTNLTDHPADDWVESSCAWWAPQR